MTHVQSFLVLLKKNVLKCFVSTSFFLFLQSPPLEGEPPASLALYEKDVNDESDPWEAVNPYLIPEGHLLRKKLDLIFSKANILDSSKNMKKAGFITPHPRTKSGVIVSRHPRIPGYLVKAYLNTNPQTDFVKWLKRIEGALQIQNSINRYGFENLLKTPKKWIYPLAHTEGLEERDGYYPKHFVLVVQDVGPLSKGGNAYAWKHQMTYDLLAALYLIISENQLIDSIRLDNAPFCHDGKIAFLDTEWYNVPESYAKVRFWKLYDYLSKEMQGILKSFEENGCP